MGGVRKFEHASLFVEDVGAAVDFYTDVMGLVELARADGTVYLGCGLDSNFDLAVSGGGTGVEHVAVRVSAGRLDELESRLAARGVPTTRTGGAEPGVLDGLRFDLPSGVQFELVQLEAPGYQHPGDVTFLASTAPVHDDRVGIAPIDVDHVTLMSPHVREDAEFLRDALGFSISDVLRDEAGEWARAFTRLGDYHHDVALFPSDRHTLHHLAWTFTDLGHLTRFLDALAQAGHTLELGIGRHGPGGNVFSYLLEPGGHRFELTCEAATVDEGTPTGYQDPDSERRGGISIWGGIHPPPSFAEGSGDRTGGG